MRAFHGRAPCWLAEEKQAKHEAPHSHRQYLWLHDVLLFPHGLQWLTCIDGNTWLVS